MATRRTLLQCALLPAFPDGVNARECEHALSKHGDALRSLIMEQGLGPFWYERTGVEWFHHSHQTAVVLYLKQRAALQQLDELFERAGIPYVVFKGAATRELVYAAPPTRVTGDVDVLVAPENRIHAVQLLGDAGFQLSVLPATVSHEVTLTDGPVQIDLHWNVMRPGRTRSTLTMALLAARRREHGMWILAETDALLLMLVHPAITDHVSGSGRTAVRIADIVRWLMQTPPDWMAVSTRLRDAGLETAAWTVLHWVRWLAPTRYHFLLDQPLHDMRPGDMRAAWLRYWIHHDLPRRLAWWHMARLTGFSIFLHDRPSDAFHAVNTLRRTYRQRTGDAAAFADIEMLQVDGHPHRSNLPIHTGQNYP